MRQRALRFLRPAERGAHAILGGDDVRPPLQQFGWQSGRYPRREAAKPAPHRSQHPDTVEQKPSARGLFACECAPGRLWSLQIHARRRRQLHYRADPLRSSASCRSCSRRPLFRPAISAQRGLSQNQDSP